MQLPTIFHTFAKDIEVATAVLFGAFMQFMFGNERNIRAGVTIILSSIFVAMYIMSPIIIKLEIQNEQIRAALYAISSLISVELIALCIVVLPGAARDKIEKFLGVDTDAAKNEKR